MLGQVHVLTLVMKIKTFYFKNLQETSLTEFSLEKVIKRVISYMLSKIV